MSDLNAFQPLVLAAALEWLIEMAADRLRKDAPENSPEASQHTSTQSGESKREERQ